jgi:hypothetical protein
LRARRHPLFVLIALLAFALPARAAFEENQSGPRADAMGGAFTAVADDVAAVDFNPAGLFQVAGVQFSGFGRLLYGGVGVGLHTAQASACLGIGRAGTIGLRFQETGYELESQRSLKLAHGIRLADGLAVGYALNGYNLSQGGGYGSGYAVGVDLAVLGQIYKIWSIGFQAHNINGPKIGSSDLPQVLTLGLAFAPAPGINSAVDISKEPGQPTRLSVGQEFRIIQNYLTLRAGVQTEPVRFAAGFRTGLEHVHLDYVMQTHPVLPLTHTLGLAVEF